MFIDILQQVPSRIWILLVALIAIGMSQTLPRRRKLRSATLLPVVMIALSFYGVASAFPSQMMAIATWAAGVTAALIIFPAVGAWADIRWSDSEQRLIVPGSWLPLVLMLGLFAVKFGVGITLALQPTRSFDMVFAMAVGLVCGVFSGGFLARGVAMWKVASEALQQRMVC